MGKYKRTAEHCKNLSKALMGNKCAVGTKWSEEHRRIMSDMFRGKKPSMETRKKMSLNNARHWLGKKRPKETCKKISSARMGMKFSEEHIKNLKIAHIGQVGSKASRWKGGITPLYFRIAHLSEYKQWRKAVFEKDDYTCQDCGQIGGKLEAHHKKAFAELVEGFLQQYDQFSPMEDKETLVRLAIKYEPFWEVPNGQTLCIACHKMTKSYLKRRLRPRKE